MTLQIRQISAKKKIQNFVETERGPFTSVDVQRYTGVNISTIRKQLCVLTNEEKIKVLRVEKGRKIYVRRGIRNKAGPGFSHDLIQVILNTIKDNRCEGVREIANLVGCSRQLICVYMEAMASVSLIGFNGAYFVDDESREFDVGYTIEKNILSKMKSSVPAKGRVRKRLLQVLRIIRKKKYIEELEWIRSHRRRV